MADVLYKIKEFFTIGERYDEGSYEEQSFDGARDYVARSRDESDTVSGSPNLLILPSRDKFRHTDYTPYCFDDMAAVVDYLKDRKAVVLCMAKLDTSFCQRVIDFISGVAYAMNCVTSMPSNDVCIIIPRDMDRELLLS